MCFELIEDEGWVHVLFYPLDSNNIEYCKKVFLQDIVDKDKCKFNKTFNNEFAYVMDYYFRPIGE